MAKNLPVKMKRYVKIWALQLYNREEFKWELGSESDTIQFSWEKVAIKGRSSMKGISYAVARAYPEFPDQQISNLATSIKNTEQMRYGDYVLAVRGHETIEKAGYIDNVERDVKRAKLQVVWSKEFYEQRTEDPLFDENEVIQRLNNRTDPILSATIGLLNNLIPLHLQRDPLEEISRYSLKEPILEYYRDPKIEEGGKMQLFFGTNRKKTGRDSFEHYYGDESDVLQFGLCEISIPRGHVQGDLERPKIWKLQFRENVNRDVVISEILEVDDNEFIKRLHTGFEQVSPKAVLVFIHGYNVTFAEAARRTGQIAWDIPFGGLTGFFSWPSSGWTLDYFRDIEIADTSILPFQEYIEIILEKTGVEEVHLIAHSMGNRILTATIKNLTNKAKLSSKLGIIKQIVLGAADLDQKVFLNNILPAFLLLEARRTIYSSDQDEALHLSAKFRHGLKRLGDAGTELFVAEGIDTVDASNIRSRGKSHGYIFDTKELLADLYYLLSQGLPPTGRRLRARQKNGINYWLFPE